MSRNIFVANLSYNMDDDALRQTFEPYGEVKKARVALDRESGRSRGFGFVDFAHDEDGRRAITALNEREVMGRRIVVKEAAPRERR